MARRFPHKTAKRVGLGMRPQRIEQFVLGLPLLFQRRPAAGLDAVYHFTFTGAEAHTMTVTIRDQTLDVADGIHGNADVAVTADSRAWIDYVAGSGNGPVKDVLSMAPALLRRRIRLRGDPRLLLRFGACFPV